jgi:hypothetical protein
VEPAAAVLEQAELLKERRGSEPVAGDALVHLSPGLGVVGVTLPLPSETTEISADFTIFAVKRLLVSA